MGGLLGAACFTLIREEEAASLVERVAHDDDERVSRIVADRPDVEVRTVRCLAYKKPSAPPCKLPSPF